MADGGNGELGELNALSLLEDFKTALEAKRVSFIRDATPFQTPLKSLIDHFTKANNAFDTANKDGKKKVGGEETARANLADFLDWHKVHKQGQDLWEKLLSAAIRSIDDDAKGHSELLSYLEEATKFEDLLYGLEPFYRDHTLHSLWVYLIGVKLMGEGGRSGR